LQLKAEDIFIEVTHRCHVACEKRRYSRSPEWP
jgi:hypothetical protein